MCCWDEFQMSLITAQSHYLVKKTKQKQNTAHISAPARALCDCKDSERDDGGSSFGSLAGAASGGERLETLVSSCSDFCGTMSESPSLHPVWGIASSCFQGGALIFQQRRDSRPCADMNLLQAERRQ